MAHNKKKKKKGSIVWNHIIGIAPGGTSRFVFADFFSLLIIYRECLVQYGPSGGVVPRVRRLIRV